MAGEMTPENAREAAKHVYGSTIGLGDGSYFDYLNPEQTDMTIDDYAYALAYTVRFRGQCWHNGRRAFYGVGQHCVIGTEEMIADGESPEDAFAFLMHEPDEMPFGDFPSPLKPQIPEEFKALIKRCGQAISDHFGVRVPNPAIVKRYDLRTYATEKRDLMPQFANMTWRKEGVTLAHSPGYEPFDRLIEPYEHPDRAAERFLELYRILSGRG